MAGQSPFSWDDWIWRHTSPLMSAENPKIFHHGVERSKFFLSRAEWMVDKLLEVIRQKVKTSLFTRGERCLTMFNGVWLMMNGIDCIDFWFVCSRPFSGGNRVVSKFPHHLKPKDSSYKFVFCFLFCYFTRDFAVPHVLILCSSHWLTNNWMKLT